MIPQQTDGIRERDTERKSKREEPSVYDGRESVHLVQVVIFRLLSREGVCIVTVTVKSGPRYPTPFIHSMHEWEPWETSPFSRGGNNAIRLELLVQLYIHARINALNLERFADPRR